MISKTFDIDLLYILAFTVGFSLFDYFAYNISAKKGWTDSIFAPYRIAQTCVQIILIAIAWAFVNGIVAIGFTLLWWTWGCDWIFHVFCLTNIFNDIKYILDKELREKYFNKISWAWWTPYGLVDLLISGKDKGTKYFKIINWKVLAVQSLIGILVTILITALCQ